MCLATDLGMGFPFEHGLQATLATLRLCDVLGVDSQTTSDSYYACLLMYAGCTVDEQQRAAIYGGSLSQELTHRQFGSQREIFGGVSRAIPNPDSAWPAQAAQLVIGLPKAARFVGSHFSALCEVAGLLAERLGVPRSVHAMFPYLTERWDGKSVLKRAAAEDIPLPVRIIQVARDAVYQRLKGDDRHVSAVIDRRSGKAFDPDIGTALIDNVADVLGPPDPVGSRWEEVLDAEPRPNLVLEGDQIDRALTSFGALTDLVSPYLMGHCLGVAELASAAAEVSGMPESEVALARRAGYVHDVGRIAVSSSIWEKTASLSADEREQVRMHTYHTDRVLARSDFLAEVSFIASSHHERLDGTGYHRGLAASALSPTARLVAVADAFQSKIEPRPYRDAMPLGAAIELLARKAREGEIDPVMVKAIAEVAGQSAPDMPLPAGLTDREAEVLGLLARGMQTKQIARQLEISPKTADRHIQNSYRKIGVSSRAAATLFASDHGLIPG